MFWVIGIFDAGIFVFPDAEPSGNGGGNADFFVFPDAEPSGNGGRSDWMMIYLAKRFSVWQD
jgi:hypothetical protein